MLALKFYLLNLTSGFTNKSDGFFCCQVFLHNPHASHQAGGRMQLGATGDVSLLNINQQVTAVCAGALNPSRPDRDVLVIGTPTNVLAYDVEDNSDLFYKEVGMCFPLYTDVLPIML